MTDTLSDKDKEVQEIVQENQRVLEQAERESEDIAKTLESAKARLHHARKVLKRAGYLHEASA